MCEIVLCEKMQLAWFQGQPQSGHKESTDSSASVSALKSTEFRKFREQFSESQYTVTAVIY